MQRGGKTEEKPGILRVFARVEKTRGFHLGLLVGRDGLENRGKRSGAVDEGEKIVGDGDGGKIARWQKWREFY